MSVTIKVDENVYVESRVAKLVEEAFKAGFYAGKTGFAGDIDKAWELYQVDWKRPQKVFLFSVPKPGWTDQEEIAFKEAANA